MKIEVGISILTVWLFFEIKDFFNNGGFSNIIATGLIKIFLILLLLTVIALMAFTLQILPGIFTNLINADSDESLKMNKTIKRRPSVNLGVKRGSSKTLPILRKNSF